MKTEMMFKEVLKDTESSGIARLKRVIYALAMKGGREILILIPMCIVVPLLSIFFFLIADLDFRSFMHWAKQWEVEQFPRFTAFVTMMVAGPWLLYGIFKRARRSRLIFLIRMTMPMWITIALLTEGG